MPAGCFQTRIIDMERPWGPGLNKEKVRGHQLSSLSASLTVHTVWQLPDLWLPRCSPPWWTDPSSREPTGHFVMLLSSSILWQQWERPSNSLLRVTLDGQHFESWREEKENPYWKSFVTSTGAGEQKNYLWSDTEQWLVSSSPWGNLGRSSTFSCGLKLV